MLKLGEMEMKFAEMIWEQAPVTTRVLIQEAKTTFDWKRTTTYTMLKRLCDRGLFQNKDGVVVVLMTKEAFLAARGEQFINDAYGGSLPKFITAFAKHSKLGDREIEALEALIAAYKDGDQ
nr:BlaI/MecI/CopY family transcriptional regulator [Fusibacter paucivorans]